MLKGIGTGVQITQPQIEPLETPKPQTQPTQDQTIPLPQINTDIAGTGQSLRFESQFTASIQQGLLNNLLDQAKLSPSINENPFHLDPIPVPKPGPAADPPANMDPVDPEMPAAEMPPEEAEMADPELAPEEAEMAPEPQLEAQNVDNWDDIDVDGDGKPNAEDPDL